MSAKVQTFSATGRRKSAVVRLRLTPGNGSFVINTRELSDYLTRETLVNHAQEPLQITETMGKVDITGSAAGGGIAGQAGAIRLALSRALVEYDSELSTTLRQAGMLTRDPRQVERKKYGQPKARKRFQYSKR
jgi:small subunit ribosomal protein S9